MIGGLGLRSFITDLSFVHEGHIGDTYRYPIINFKELCHIPCSTAKRATADGISHHISGLGNPPTSVVRNKTIRNRSHLSHPSAHLIAPRLLGGRTVHRLAHGPQIHIYTGIFTSGDSIKYRQTIYVPPHLTKADVLQGTRDKPSGGSWLPPVKLSHSRWLRPKIYTSRTATRIVLVLAALSALYIWPIVEVFWSWWYLLFCCV